MDKAQRLTQEGVSKYEERLEYLKTVRRQEIAEQIQVARAFGDISENAEYDEAKNEQARIEREIMQIENMLRTAIIIDEDSIDFSVVNLGTRVTVLDVEMNEEQDYIIVSTAESDPLEHKISIDSPVGKALLGNGAGSEVTVQAPGGNVVLKILNIHK